MGKDSKDGKSRSMDWMIQPSFQGWVCSICEWNFPLPTLLSDPEAKTAYDRLATAKFRQHDCAHYLPRLKSADPATFTERIRKLVSQGFKPKDAVDILLQEVELESMNDPKALDQARREGQDFLRRLREGLM